MFPKIKMSRWTWPVESTCNLIDSLGKVPFREIEHEIRPTTYVFGVGTRFGTSTEDHPLVYICQIGDRSPASLEFVIERNGIQLVMGCTPDGFWTKSGDRCFRWFAFFPLIIFSLMLDIVLSDYNSIPRALLTWFARYASRYAIDPFSSSDCRSPRSYSLLLIIVHQCSSAARHLSMITFWNNKLNLCIPQHMKKPIYCMWTGFRWENDG